MFDIRYAAGFLDEEVYQKQCDLASELRALNARGD